MDDAVSVVELVGGQILTEPLGLMFALGVVVTTIVIEFELAVGVDAQT